MVKILLFSSGVIIALLPFLAFFWMNKAWGDFFYSNVTFNLNAHTHHLYDFGLLMKFKGNFETIGTRIHFLWSTIVLFALYGVIRVTRVERKERTLLIVWIVGTILSICMGWWLFCYHYIILIPSLALFASYGFFQLLDRLPSQRGKMYQVARGLIVSLLILFLLIEFLLAYHYSYVSTGIIPGLIGMKKADVEEIYSSYKVQEYTITDFSIKEDYRLSKYIKTHTQKGEKIFIWGWEALVYFLSEREPASRYIFIYPLIQNNLDMRRGAQKIFWEELNETKPCYFIVAKKDQNPLDEIGSEKRLSFLNLGNS